MAEPDIYSLMMADDADAGAQAQAMAAALRRQKAAQVLGALAKPNSAAAIGDVLGEQAKQEENLLERGATARLHFGPQMEERRARLAARKDPNTAVLLRQALGKLGVQAPEGTPVETMEYLLPLSRQMHHDDIAGALRRKQLKYDQNTGQWIEYDPYGGGVAPAPGVGGAPARPGGAPGGPNKRADKLAADMDAALDPFTTKGGLKNYTDQVMRAQKLDRLLIDEKTGKPKTLLTPQDMTETAIALQQLVAAGHASSTEVEHLVPQGIGTDVGRLAQYFTDQPWDANKQEWAARMLHTASREAALALETGRRGQVGRVPTTVGLRQLQAPRWESILKAKGLDPTHFDEWGNLIPGKTGFLQTAEESLNMGGGHAAPGAASQLPVVKTKEERDALPAGTKYQGADGKVYTKKG